MDKSRLTIQRTIALILAMLATGWGASSLSAQDSAAKQSPDRPNILWITCEDISSHIGCYGDDYAVTPNIDHLATQGVRYTHAFAPIDVCAPARSCLITGMYPPSIGTQHMRCRGTLPKFVRCFPEYLREAGYYCTNNVKTDYNFAHPKTVWDESSRKAHWRGRKPGQPFFAVFNYTSCHESKIRQSEKSYQERVANFTAAEKHDSAKAPVPPYHPDTPEVRKDWARYADMITFMDKQVGGLLKQLEDDGLAENTIVFFFSDHGAGMPRSKRWLYDSSTRVPFIVRCPKKYQKLAPGKANTTTDRLVNFVDFGPTVLSLAGVKIAKHIQGKPFLGSQAAEPREYVYGFRDRMDERCDMIRSVRDKRYKYIRNYMAHLPWFHDQHISYMYQMPTMKVWQRLANAGKLRGPQAVFMAGRKPAEELYDTEADPHEVRNLAASPEHQRIKSRLRRAHVRWVVEITDLGLFPEADLRTRFGDKPPYVAVREKGAKIPLGFIHRSAWEATDETPKIEAIERLAHEDAAIRFWACIGLAQVRGADREKAAAALTKALADPAPTVRVAAADALCRLDQEDKAVPVLVKAMHDKNEWVRLQAINVLDRIDSTAPAALAAVKQARKDSNNYVKRVAEHATLSTFKKP